MQLALQRVEEHAVDGEVAALRVLLGRGEHDRVGPAAVGVGAVGAEGGDLDREPFAVVAARADHLDDAEAAPRSRCAAEQRPDLLRPGVGGDVVVLRGEAEEFVADAAAGPQGRVPGLLELADDVDGELALGHNGQDTRIAARVHSRVSSRRDRSANAISSG